MRRLAGQLGRTLLLFAVPLLVMAGGTGLWQRLDEPITRVRVQGPLTDAERTAVQRVVDAALPAGLLSIDLEALRSRLYALSWPRRVSIRRHWPQQLDIELHKEMVVAAWGDAAYLTTAAKVVELADAAPGLPTLHCAQAAPQRAMEVYQMLEERAGAAGLVPRSLIENELGEWTLELSDGTRVTLGRDELAARIDRFLRVYHHAAEPAPGARLIADARYANGVAVRWQNIDGAETLAQQSGGGPAGFAADTVAGVLR